MASKRAPKTKDKLIAKLVVGKTKLPCAFCNRKADDEIIYGKLYEINDIQCHYFCVLLSCCLVQKGKDEDGLLGFLYKDIVAEVERSKKHRCSYCGRGGATLGCSVTRCRKQFHLPCGRERNAVSLFYDNYKSFCVDHAPKQKIPDSIMAKAKLRMPRKRKANKNVKITLGNLDGLKELGMGEVKETGEICKLMIETKGDHNANKVLEPVKSDTEEVCVICYEEVEGYPTTQTFWPPCCARDAWFHRTCLQRMALSAGMHYLKCPLCNDKENFYRAVVSQGYYVPDRDAAWELEQNAFAEIYERPVTCSASECRCPMGREHDADTGTMWDIKICLLCGSTGVHAYCLQVSLQEDTAVPLRYVCNTCQPAAPSDLDQLETSIAAVTLSDQPTQSRTRSGPVMPSRMSLRRTKQRALAHSASTSQANNRLPVFKTETIQSNVTQNQTNTTQSRAELNLKQPKRQKSEGTVLKGIENTFLSPTKLLEETLSEKILQVNVKPDFVDKSEIVEIMRKKFKKPRPLCEKKRIVNHLLEKIFNSSKECVKTKEPIKEWVSPKKQCDREEVVQKAPEIECAEAESDTNTDTNENTSPTIEETILFDDDDLIIGEETTIVDDITMIDEESPKSTGNHEIKTDDESSNSTFQLPSEFIADQISDDSFSTLETPKKLKTVEFKKDSSMEISENNEIVNIDVIKIENNSDNEELIKSIKVKSPSPSKKCSFKFSPLDKEILQKNNIDIDLESFKNHYLHEVDRNFTCNYSHKHEPVKNRNDTFKLKTAIDFAIDATFNNQENNKNEKQNKIKRKVIRKVENRCNKKRKLDDGKKGVLKYRKQDSRLRIQCSKGENNRKQEKNRRDKHKKSKKLKKNIKAKVSIQNKNIQVKIKFREERLRLKIIKKKSKRAKKLIVSPQKTLKQYVLKYSPVASSSKEIIVKPETDVTPLKRKYVRQEMTSDNLVQTSIQNFFKIKVPAKTNSN